MCSFFSNGRYIFFTSNENLTNKKQIVHSLQCNIFHLRKSRMKKLLCIVFVALIPQQLNDFISTIQYELDNEMVILKTILDMENAGMFY